MKSAQTETFNNLIDIVINYDEDPDVAGSADTMLKKILVDYFFHTYTDESKNLQQAIKNLKVEGPLTEKSSLLEVTTSDLQSLLEGESINDTLCGRIMLSPAYLKIAYPHHNPAFNKLPSEDKGELINAIKEKNDAIMTAFEKMQRDIDAARNRKVLTLIALILKNIHMKTGLPLVKHEQNAESIIRNIFTNCDTAFTASQGQLSDLNDESKIKNTIKAFFVIKKFRDIQEISELFKNELERFTKRTQRIAQLQ
jgi:hypothetical protein